MRSDPGATLPWIAAIVVESPGTRHKILTDDAGQMDTDGNGENQPADTSDNPAGKANNRRIEFIKQ